MKHQTRILSLILLFLSANLLVFSQKNEATQVKKEKIPISGNERYDFVFGRGLLIPFGSFANDSIPIDPTRSGSFYTGIGFHIPIGSVIAINLEPRVNWHKVYYKNDGNRVFPTDTAGKYKFEKHRMLYVELPVGLKINLVRNREEKVKLFMELGGFGGINVAATYKRRREDGKKRFTEKFHYIDNLELLRYGAYFRFGTNWGAFNFSYRFSDVFKADKSYLHPDRQTSMAYPKFSPLEFGFVILL